MENYPIALFGEAEKGDFGTAYFFQSLSQVIDSLGNPPPESQGMLYAVQTLLYERDLLFFRVKEEGFSYQDYFYGLRLLEKQEGELNISAICLPGVGDREIIKVVTEICDLYKVCMITTEPDLYDLLTGLKAS
ncbi:MAG: hypothetical protein VX777_04030 [Chlamydiota bacterium]|nr:hypothetical protein [Chlamydiota bacterium]